MQGERDRTSKMIAALQAEKETEQAMKEQELSKAQAEIWVKQQEAERHNSKLKATAVSGILGEFCEGKNRPSLLIIVGNSCYYYHSARKLHLSCLNSRYLLYSGNTSEAKK